MSWLPTSITSKSWICCRLPCRTLLRFLWNRRSVAAVEQVDLSLTGVDSTVIDFIFLLTGVDLSVMWASSSSLDSDSSELVFS
ncbi:hypothetical protein Taro_023636 [Colocasia esculenta]|uniref:Uncharacterized protein n=1 Tax=Colocasia esculenta TaxID=4460 RepID=A0A843V4P0_COLES|nr:hypothetical protein [Colocasia esculenta]